MRRGGSTQALLSLLRAFTPAEWREELYLRAPPFAMEESLRGLVLLPLDEGVAIRFDELSQSIGLRRRNGVHEFSASRSDAVRAIRTFRWFARRSWRRKDFSVVWAIMHFIPPGSGWVSWRAPVEAIAEVASCEVTACRKVLNGMIEGSVASPPGFEEYAIDRRRLYDVFEELLREIPSWTEEQVMSVLCSTTEASASDIYDHVARQGLSISAVYKVVEKLKREGFIQPVRHVRVEKRGPMRELLSASCRSCFFGYASEERCFQASFLTLRKILETHYQRRLTGEEWTELYKALRAIPYSSRIVRKLNDTLRLVAQIEERVRERAVLTMLKRLEDVSGVKVTSISAK